MSCNYTYEKISIVREKKLKKFEYYIISIIGIGMFMCLIMPEIYA